MPASPYLIGIISDTHGLLRPEAVQALQGTSLILHAGDVGKPEVLADLKQIAPLQAVRGNVDHGMWSQALPYTRVVQTGGHLLYMLHDLTQLEIDPVAAGISAVISGHSHRPLIERRNGVLYINPGSAGPRRFHLPVMLAHLTLGGDQASAVLVDLLHPC